MVTTQVMPHQQVQPLPTLRSASRRLEAYRPRRNCFEMLNREAEFERRLMPHKADLGGGVIDSDTSLL
ncbi:MAG: hypothetical protein AAF892_01205 [Cyanobacteria bacterium P01_D01_bin.71]